PRLRGQKRRRRERDLAAAVAAFREAAPRPVLRATDEPGAQSVAFDVPAGAHELVGRANGDALEAALIDGPLADGLTMMLPSHGMGNGYPVQELRERAGIDRAQHQVPVIREDAVRQQPRRVP